jgi:hypothetical protein
MGTMRNALSLFADYKRTPARECLLSSLCSLLPLTSGVRVWLTSRLRQSLFGTTCTPLQAHFIPRSDASSRGRTDVDIISGNNAQTTSAVQDCATVLQTRH